MAELKDALNFMRRGTVHKNCSCQCEVCRPEGGEGVCKASEVTFHSVTRLCEEVLCPKPEEEEFHALSCIRGDCMLCGATKLKICPNELSGGANALVSWKLFEMVFVGRGEDGNDRHALRLEHKLTPPCDLVSSLRSHLEEFLVHNFEAKWQDQQFKVCMGNLSPDAIVSVVDFAENYAFKWQNEVQSQHWFSFQVSILVHITFRIHHEWDGLDPENKILTEYHFYISDDKSHDNNFVQYCFGLHRDFLKEQGFLFPVEHIVFSDGCASQFKCAKSLYFVARYPSLTISEELPLGCVMQWNHFGTGHGKGQWDGAGAHVKEALRREQVKPDGVRLHNSSDVVTFLRQAMNREYAGYHSARRSVHRHFYDVKEADVNQFQAPNARTVEGTRSFHQVRSVGLEGTSLQTRRLSCFCKFCLDGGDGPCDSAGFVEPFTLIRLEPCEPQTLTRRDRARLDAQETRLHPHMSARESLAATLEVGDHFAVLADDGTGFPEFWILQCQEPLHGVEEDKMEDTWGQTVYRGEQIVIGTYYKQRGSSRSSYIREDPRRPAFIYSHLVVATKFDLPAATHRQKGGRGGTQVYKLTTEAQDHIHSQLLVVD